MKLALIKNHCFPLFLLKKPILLNIFLLEAGVHFCASLNFVPSFNNLSKFSHKKSIFAIIAPKQSKFGQLVNTFLQAAPFGFVLDIFNGRVVIEKGLFVEFSLGQVFGHTPVFFRN